MANFNKLFHEEVRRLARKEVKEAVAALKSENTRLRKTLSQVKQRLDELERTHRRKSGNGSVNGAASSDAASESRPRITGKTVRLLRERLKLTQAEFGKLLGVSGQSVYQWERRDGKLRLRHATIRAYLAAKQLGVREARKHVDENP
ncbi:MAG: helix-turn-helix domain-containing protein [Candidatus Hydrogenedentes bacterium]|nr:helix-turn-helix domain-containing protein [Candidatus Hydrogenedentota bacterium]